jgi:large subunit ribosomal protein L18
MLTRTSKNTNRRHVHERIRKKILGTSERPRLNVYRSLNHIYVQLIDDQQGNTVVFAHSAEGKKGERRTGGNVASAKEVGKLIAERATAKGINKVVLRTPRAKPACSSRTCVEPGFDPVEPGETRRREEIKECQLSLKSSMRRPTN